MMSTEELEDFACGILNLIDKNRSLEANNKSLREIVDMHNESCNNYIDRSEKMFGEVLLATLDPDSLFNKRMKVKK